MIVFSHLANYIPVRNELKLRVEGKVGIVSNGKNYRVDFLNETALIIFQLIDGKKSVENIVQCFLEKVDVDRDIFEQDLVEILRNFLWQKLIVLKYTK